MRRATAAMVIAGTLAMAGRVEVGARQNPRETARAAPAAEGTATISGLVVTDDTSTTPMRRAIVTLSGVGIGNDRAFVTNTDGRFSFNELPAGTYAVSAAKPSFVTTYWGSQEIGRGPGVAIAVADQGVVTDVRLALTRGAVIAGTVRDTTGRGQRNATISVMSAVVHSAPVVITTTDDRGDYRVFGLAPGSYLVAVQPGFNFNGAVPPAGSNGPGIGSPPRGMHVTYSPVLYPGTTDPSLATPIALSAGEERAGVDIALQFVASSNIAGHFVDPDGHIPTSLQATLVWPWQRIGLGQKNYDGPTAMATNGSLITRNGAFDRQALTPGHYTVLARAADPKSVPGAANALAKALSLWAIADFDLDGQDVPDLVITLHRGMTISGRVAVRDGGTALDVTTLRVALTPASRAGWTLGVEPAAPARDGAFELHGVPPGRYRLTVSGGNGWAARSARVGDIDLLDTPIDIDAGHDLDGVEVLLTDRPTTLAGTLRDALDRPVPGDLVVIFSDDRRFWDEGSRHVAQVRPSTDGRFSVTGLPPGRYHVAAVTALPPGDLADATFLDSLATAALDVTLDEGHVQTINLKLASGSHQ